VLTDTDRSHALRTSGTPPTARPPLGNALVTMRLWAMDVRVRDATVLRDRDHVRNTMHDAAESGGLTVLGEEFCDFDNGGLTAVLVLAQSHLSIHTWPEFALANVDLLSYGDVPGGDVLRRIGNKLGAERLNVTCVTRRVP
jgi:S-adenosylmethionine decarboxylase